MTAEERAGLLSAGALGEAALGCFLRMNNLLLSCSSHWFIAGDGAAFDIDFNGVDHVVASGAPVKILILCNQVYGNTGGQPSKNSYPGQVGKNSYNGVSQPAKQMGLMLAAAYGRGVYVAQTAPGYNRAHTARCLREAEQFAGPGVVLAYCPCISHLIDGGLGSSEEHQRLAVETGMWPVFRWNGA